MAKWQYSIEHVEVPSGKDLDGKLGTALTEFGSRGWELVDILHHHDNPSDYHLIFKSEEPLME